MAFTTQQLQAGFRIGDCHVDPPQNRITRPDGERRVERRVMDVLVCLAARAGEVVSRDTLNQEVWGDVVVTDQAVTNCISELRQHLNDDRTANRVIETIPKRGYRLTAPVQLAGTSAPVARPARAVRRRLIAATALGTALVIGLAAWWWWQARAHPSLTSVAVVRFENAAGDDTLDYLELALPDEIATLLTKSRELAVRPLAYVDAKDPLAGARARGVDHIVTGRYYRENDGQLALSIEAQHVPGQRVIWRTRISAPDADLLAMRGRLADSVQRGLLPALGASSVPLAQTAPADAEAYQLYLRSLALPQQPRPTERAIEMLEQAVTLEPQFAPAWLALGSRYYDQGTWWAVTGAARDKALAANRRALELDPELISAARQIITHRVESGDLDGAYREARDLLKRYGASADTHFAISYVLRYGGLLDAAQRHCELARDRDRHDPRLRSCGYTYLYAGKLDRVTGFFELDEGAYFTLWANVLYHLRRDDRAAALQLVRQAAAEPTRGLMEPCLAGATGAALDAPVDVFVQHWQRSGDPEAHYALAPMLAYCGRPEEAFRLLERAINGGFCAFPALDLDPVWATLRDAPEFQRIRARAMGCHERFRRAVEAYEEPG